MNLAGELFVIIANVFWATNGIFVKFTNDYTTPMVQVVIRQFIVVCIYLLMFGIKERNLKFLKVEKKYLLKLILTGVFGVGLISIFFTIALVNTNFANAVTLLNFSAVFVIILSFIFLKEKITGKTIFSTIVAIIGVIIMLRPSLGLDKGIVFALIASFMYSIYIVLISSLKKVHIGARLVYGSGFAVLTVIPFALIFESPIIITDIGLVLFYQLFAGIAIVGGFYFFNLAINKIPANIAGILNISEPIFAVFIGYFIFGEILKSYELIGSALIILAIVILNIKFKRNKVKKIVSNS